MSILSEYDEVNMEEKHRRHLTQLNINSDDNSFDLVFLKSNEIIRSGCIHNLGKVTPGIYLIIGPYPDKHSIRCWGYYGDMIISHIDQKYEHKYRMDIVQKDLEFLIKKLGPGSWIRIIANGHKIPSPWDN